MDEREIFALLKEKTRSCGRPVKDSELAHQIRSSRRTAWCPRNPQLFTHGEELHYNVKLPPESPTWPQPDLELIDQIISEGFHLGELRQYSPVKFEPDCLPHSEEIFDAIWPGNPLLCCGKDVYTFTTRRREVWRGSLHRYPYTVPNPQLTVKGLTQDGKQSEHTLEATAARIYQVVEFDFAEFAPDGTTETNLTPFVRKWKANGITILDACAAILLHLSVARDLVLVVHSGGKSLHGWYACFDLHEKNNRQFFEYATRLGADPRTWLRSQFVRMPDGIRDNGKRQSVYYFDPGKAVNV
jgi:hypothetical protein